MIYHGYDAHARAMHPMRELASALAPVFHDPRYGLTDWRPLRRVAAALEVLSVAALTHQRPAFGIGAVRCGAREHAIEERVVARTSFATLLQLRKRPRVEQPAVLLVAPMSGHFATLLRDTARTMLADHDVYITDWHNARDVPLGAGPFGLDEYVHHLISFMRAIGPGAHMMAICQPCVAALAAVALMAEDDDPAVPASLTLMAGPIDCRINPTAVNRMATSRPIEWFERNLISTVPLRFDGARRRVYPGFVQVAAFMSMNLERHLGAFRSLYEDLLAGERERAAATREFYREYFAVSDLPAEFYLDTVRRVFQEHELPTGRLAVAGRRIEPRAIRRTALLTVEGERDDICALGQTLAAHDICASLRAYMRTHYVQPGAGHYGVFSGRRWSGGVYPVVRQVIHSSG